MTIQNHMKLLLAVTASILILWKPTLVVIFKDYFYETDLSTVCLHDACIGSTTQTVFVFCLLEVLVAAVLLKNFVVPALFGTKSWTGFDEIKRKKIVGYVIKITVRVSCAIQIFVLVWPYFSMQDGLFASANVKKAYVDLVRDKIITSCEQADMSLLDAAALRAWVFVRDNLMAVMVWELAYIPELQVDVWFHHLFIILGVTLGSDPQLLGSFIALQPFIDGIAFWLVLGAALMAVQEFGVLMYHVSAPKVHQQAAWMKVSAWTQLIVVIACFVGPPISLVVQHRKKFGPLFLTALLVLAFLIFLELKMILSKRSIIAHALQKSNQTAGCIDHKPENKANVQESDCIREVAMKA